MIDYKYRVKLESVTDGDTIRFLIDHGMYQRSEHAIRLSGVSAAEDETPEGKIIEAWVMLWFAEHHSHSQLKWPFMIVTEKDKQSFNRYIGVVSCLFCGAILNKDLEVRLSA